MGSDLSISTFCTDPFESELSPPDQFNALEYLLGPQLNERVVYEESDQTKNSEPEVSNNVDLSCLQDIFDDVISRPMDELDQLLMEAGIEIGQSKNINPVAVENETQAAPSSEFASSEPYAQPPLQMPSPDDIVLLPVETKMTEEPCVPVEPDPHPGEHRVVKRKMASKSRRKPFKPIENDSNSSMSTASPDVSSHDELMTDRRKRNHRRAQQTYTKRISSYFEKIRELLRLKKSTSYTACLDKVTTEIKCLMRRVESLTEEATVRKKEDLVRIELVESLQQNNAELRQEVKRLQQENSGLHQGLESKCL